MREGGMEREREREKEKKQLMKFSKPERNELI